jgi:hypothetical protein
MHRFSASQRAAASIDSQSHGDNVSVITAQLLQRNHALQEGQCGLLWVRLSMQEALPIGGSHPQARNDEIFAQCAIRATL